MPTDPDPTPTGGPGGFAPGLTPAQTTPLAVAVKTSLLQKLKLMQETLNELQQSLGEVVDEISNLNP